MNRFAPTSLLASAVASTLFMLLRYSLLEALGDVLRLAEAVSLS
jgi:hypothetical protein